MMNIEDFRNMFRAHLSHEIWDKWRKGQLDVSRRRNTPDGCEYEELPKEAADQILDGGEIHSCEDLADPTEVISDRYACSPCMASPRSNPADTRSKKTSRMRWFSSSVVGASPIS